VKVRHLRFTEFLEPHITMPLIAIVTLVAGANAKIASFSVGNTVFFLQDDCR